MNTSTISLASLLVLVGAAFFPVVSSAQPAPTYPPPAPTYPPPVPDPQPAYNAPAPAPQPVSAAAQPAYNNPTPHPSYAAPAPQPAPGPAPQPTVAKPSRTADLLSRIQVGFGFLTGGMTSDRYGDSDGAFGYGLFARYRFNHRWEVEASLGVERIGLTNGGTREFRPIAASALVYLLNLRGVEVYGRAGLGRSSETYTNYTNSRPVLEFSATHFHLGAGATYVFRKNIGVSAEMQWAVINRSESRDSESFSSSGTRYGLSASYHF